MPLLPPQSAVPPPKEDEQTSLSQQVMITRIVGKGCLGLGFIVAIVGVTNASPVATRSGLALLAVGIVASVTSLVHAFKRHRLRRSQSR
jgi:hypothetical protein